MLADWVELNALHSPDGRIGFGTLVSASDMATEEQDEDIADEDVRQDDLVVSVQAEINERRKVVGPDYPFSVDGNGAAMQMVADVTPVGAIYLFCLFLSHAAVRTIIPEELAPEVDNDVRDLFQVCATIAAAGYVEGIGTSFGWPRPDGAEFLPALQRIYALFGDGTPVDEPPPAAPDDVKDDGIDVIAWRPSPDGLPGTHYLVGQVASGKNWRGKTVKAYMDSFHQYWFTRQPASPASPAMFMPFCLEPKANEDFDRQEIAVDHMQKLVNQFGILVYRYRMASYAARGLKVNAESGHLIERLDELPRVAQWVRDYSDRLRAATN